jgi:hypothetical protein
MNTPDYISAIVGYRIWQWDTDRLQLLNGEPWFPNRPLVASCRPFASRTIAGRNEAAHSADQPRKRIAAAACTQRRALNIYGAILAVRNPR